MRGYNTFSYPAGIASGYDPTHLASTQKLRLSCVATATKQLWQLFPNFGFAASIAANSSFGMDAYVGPCILPWVYSECRFVKAVQDTTGTFAAILLGPSTYSLGGAGNSSLLADTQFASGGVRLDYDGTDGHLMSLAGTTSPFQWLPATPIIIPKSQPFFVAHCYRENGPACFVLRNLLTGALRAEPSSANNTAIGSTSAAMTYCLGGSRFNAEGGDEKFNCAMFSGDYLGLEALVKWSEDPWSFWYPRQRRRQIGTIVGFTGEILRPDADTSISDWTNQAGGTTGIFGTIDEAISDDADYIQSPLPPSGSVARFRLSDPSLGNGTIASPLVVSYRFKRDNTNDQLLTVSLKQGTTLIASWTHSGAGLTQTFQTVEQTLTAPQLASITDFTNLFIEFQASSADPGFSLVNTAIDFISPESTTHTFSNKAIGTPSATRQIFVGIASRRAAAGAISSASVTIGGVAMTPVIVTCLDPFYSGIFKAAVPAGATATIVVTYNNSMTDTTLGVYAVGGGSTSVIDTDFDAAINPNFNRTFDSAATYGVGGYGIIYAGVCGFSGHISGATNVTLDSYTIVATNILGEAVGSNVGPLTASTTVTIYKTAGTQGQNSFAVVGM